MQDSGKSKERRYSGVPLLIAVLAVVPCLILLCQNTRAHETQAYCKDRQIPADRVVVGEFESFECTPIGEINAWDTDVPKEGTITCDAVSIWKAANVLQFMTCETVVAKTCPIRPDGLGNAYVLRTALECAKRGVTFLRMGCDTQVVNPRANESEIANVHSTTCPETNNRGPNNVRVVKVNSPDVSKPVISCTDYFGGAEAKTLQNNEIIIRRFHKGDCEDYSWFGKGRERALNAIATMQIFKRPPENITLCLGTPMINRDGPPENRDEFIVYEESRKQYVYDEQCGGERGVPNGVRILPHPKFRMVPPTRWD